MDIGTFLQYVLPIVARKMAKQKMRVLFWGGCKKDGCLLDDSNRKKRPLRIEPGVLGNASYAIRAVGVA